MQINSSESFPHLQTNTTSAMLSLICPISHCDSDSAASKTSEKTTGKQRKIGLELHDTMLIRSFAARRVALSVAL